MARNIPNIIKKLPKIELHVHLEGAAQAKTIEKLSRRTERSFSLRDLKFRKNPYTYKNLNHFISTIKTVMNNALRLPEDYERIAYEHFIFSAEQNVRYMEISFDPYRGRRLGISFDVMLQAVNRARKRAQKEKPIRIGLLIGCGRENGAKTAKEFINLAIKTGNKGIVGIDLHGDEGAAPATEFAEIYDLAREAGLGLRTHAGEGTGPESIWDVINHLKVTRIAHGVRSAEDERLLQYLSYHPVTLDMCLTSNFKLGIVKSITKHPLRQFFDRGIRVTVNTDDPFFFNTTITREYELLATKLKFSLEEIRQITLNAVEASFLPEKGKKALRQEVI
jgi:adenosine deaminase